MKFDRSVWSFLPIGFALRCVALNQPLIDAHLIRQCQTAEVTRNLMSAPGLHFASKIPWLGDLKARYLLELPLYNYLVIALNAVVRNLDISGKLMSILLWAASFLVLQTIWRRCLTPAQPFWANLLFVFAPLSVFFGQAFMPEMLVQLLALGFIVTALRYDEDPTLARWTTCAGIGLIGLLLKLPEIAHLYLIPGFLVFRREKWDAFLRPRYWITAIITLVVIKLWSGYMDTMNAAYLPEWTSRGNLHDFMGTWGDRLQLRPWATVFLYIAVLVAPGAALIGTARGFYVFLRRNKDDLLRIWLSSLALYYLVWFGNAGPAGQSYYNLTALAPLCALFGIGIADLLERMRSWQRAAAICVATLVVLSAIPGGTYLFRQDRQILETARWAKQNTRPDDIILFQLNHRPDMINYKNNPVPAYLSERETFVWTATLSSNVARDALGRSRYAILTEPRVELNVINRWRGAPKLAPLPRDWLKQAGLQPISKQPGFEVFQRD